MAYFYLHIKKQYIFNQYHFQPFLAIFREKIEDFVEVDNINDCFYQTFLYEKDVEGWTTDTECDFWQIPTVGTHYFNLMLKVEKELYQKDEPNFWHKYTEYLAKVDAYRIAFVRNN